MNLKVERYLNQQPHWPLEGRHILAQFDEGSVVVYQAYRPAIGHFAAARGYFGGGFKFDRMSWIKPNFLWMMYRSGWGTKEHQESTLAVRLHREFFDRILKLAAPSSFKAELYPSMEAWQEAVKRSDVRLQWDPDHDPSGDPLPRRAIQLGLRGTVLAEYAKDAIIEIEDISDFVAEQRANVTSTSQSGLLTPAERVYPISDPDTAWRLRVAPWQGGS